jgi:hypothetical protein
MTLAELLDRAIGLYRRHFLIFIGIIAIPYIPLMLIQMGLQLITTTSMMDGLSTAPNSANPFESFNPAVIGASMGSILVVFVQFILVQGVASAALTRAVANNYMGRPVGILDSFRTLQDSWLRLILALVVIFVLAFLLFIWMIIPCIGWFTGPGLLMFVSLIVSPLVAPVIVLERGDILASIRRAWDLARGRFWWLVGYAFVIALFGQLIITGPVYLISFSAQSLQSLFQLDFDQQLIVSTIIQNLVTISTSLLYLPLQLTIMTVIYFDLRARAEGLDLAMQLPGESGAEPVMNGLPEIASKSQAPLFTRMDLGRFALLSLAAIAFYALIVSAVMFLGLLAL